MCLVCSLLLIHENKASDKYIHSYLDQAVHAFGKSIKAFSDLFEKIHKTIFWEV